MRQAVGCGGAAQTTEVVVRTIVKGKKIEVPAAVRRYAEKRFGRIERLLDDRSDAIVELSVERHRNDEESYI